MNTTNTTVQPDGCDFEPYKCHLVVVTRLLSALLSTFGALFMIVVILALKKQYAFLQRLILYLSIAGLMNSLAYLLSPTTPVLSAGSTCTFQAFVLQFTDWSVLLWVCCLTIGIWQSMLHGRTPTSLERPMHMVAWGVPACMAAWPWVGGVYGPTEFWCWITKPYWKERLYLWYVPLGVALVCLVSANLYVWYAVNRRLRIWQGLYTAESEQQKAAMKREASRLLVYPFIYLVLNLFAFMNRIEDIFTPDDPPIFLFVWLHTITAPLQGALNAVCYGLDSDTYSKLTWANIKSIFGRKNERRTVQEYPVGRVDRPGRYQPLAQFEIDEDDEDDIYPMRSS
eukprot:comp6398_c0_seq1/m.2198 comp6398_c0_seq1/g.2198  ORF comp6398_c0_seq1/g.2198 comp6398_c0_seq1/m.2198 type:complete len:340 (-) comp6398_c0_seq1:297-1316(-)